MIVGSLKTPCASSVTTLVPSIYPITIQRSKSKHIKIHYHFIRDLMEEKILWLEFINIDNQKADIFTKPLDGPRFESLCNTIGVGIIPWLISLVWPTLDYWCIHVKNVSYVIVSISSLCLFFHVFVDLTLFVLFLSVLKNSKTYKKWKILESLIVCVVYITCEFGLVPLY